MKILTLSRQWYTATSTIGQLIYDNKPICFTLEDTVRAYGIKVKDSTAIPVCGGVFYKVEITYSNRFKKELPIIYTEISKDGDYVLKNGGIEFTAIRIHGGNSEVDTSGCILAAESFDGVDKIYNKADDLVTALIKDLLKSDTVGLNVRNFPNKFN